MRKSRAESGNAAWRDYDYKALAKIDAMPNVPMRMRTRCDTIRAKAILGPQDAASLAQMYEALILAQLEGRTL